MDMSLFTEPSGRLLGVEEEPPLPPYVAFIPDPLSPIAEDAAISIVARELGAANLALGRLMGIGEFFPNPDLLVRPYLRREAIASSRIEGTRASFSDVVALEAGMRPLPGSDAKDVLNYVGALDSGLRAVQDEPVSQDLLRSLHRQVMTGARGEKLSNSGEFRFIQNHVGTTNEILEARYVPPPPNEMREALGQLIGYLNKEKALTPVLVETAWMHYQFEAIHPFLDGNGRVGRLLIPLLLAARHELIRPLLYLSPYFERRKDEYYDLLLAVSTTSVWEDWLRFFLIGVAEQAEEAVSVAREVIALGAEWRARLAERGATPSTQRLADFALEQVVVTPTLASSGLEISRQTAYSAIAVLVDLAILDEFLTVGRRTFYIAPELVAILDL